METIPTPRPLISFYEEMVDPSTGEIPDSIVTAGYLTPPQIAKAYGTPASTGLGVKVGIFSFGGGFKQSDFNSSFADLKTAGYIPSNLTAPTIRQVLLNGQQGTFSTSDNNASLENTLDIYCIGTLVPQASITLYIGNNYTSMMNQAIADGCHIVSISWGSSEYTSDEANFINAVSNKIAVLASSGDYGSEIGNVEGVIYPSSSPNVMSIGGTNLTLYSNAGGLTDTRFSEVDSNASGVGGGGGLSAVFSLPTWQSGLLYTPITNNVTGTPTQLNARGLPDVSGPFYRYSMYYNGSGISIGGTSASCPTIAGFLARFQQLTEVQRSSPDWNTFFYTNPYGSLTKFYDITTGNNTGALPNGYSGTVGWDAVTGLGAPNNTPIYQSLHTGGTFPKKNYGFRPTTGAAYPRKTTGAR
jgi:subtilase family serine protease